MRPVLVVALLGTAMSVTIVEAQSSPESNAKVHKKQRPSTAMDALFENGPERPHALEEAAREAAERKGKEQKSADSAASTESAPVARPVIPTVEAVPPGPPQKKLTGGEFKLIHMGSPVKEVLNVLGPPSSRMVVPDDDGHLRETLEYWMNGAPLGTVRLDNGRVIEIETKAK